MADWQPNGSLAVRFTFISYSLISYSLLVLDRELTGRRITAPSVESTPIRLSAAHFADWMLKEGFSCRSGRYKCWAVSWRAAERVKFAGFAPGTQPRCSHTWLISPGSHGL